MDTIPLSFLKTFALAAAALMLFRAARSTVAMIAIDTGTKSTSITHKSKFLKAFFIRFPLHLGYLVQVIKQDDR